MMLFSGKFRVCLSWGLFHDHRITDGHKHIGPNSILLRGKSISHLGRTFPGRVAKARNQPCITSQTSNNVSLLEASVWDASKKKKRQNSPLPLKHGAEKFPNNFHASVDALICKFCQHHLDWIRGDRLLALWSPCGKTNTLMVKKKKKFK